jgi:hypothetical protein
MHGFQVEIAIAQEFVTPALVAKERMKIQLALLEEEQNGNYGWGSPQATAAYATQADWTRGVLHSRRGAMIPRLLETVYHCVVTEELWTALKQYKDPTIDFKKLRRHVIAQTKSLAKDLF